MHTKGGDRSVARENVTDAPAQSEGRCNLPRFATMEGSKLPVRACSPPRRSALSRKFVLIIVTLLLVMRLLCYYWW